MRLRFPAELAAAVVVTIALCVPTNVLCGSTEAALYRESMEVSIEKGGYTNKLYFLTATLGSPPSEFKFCIDTGSSDTWVASTRCKSAGCSTLKKYDGRVSTSFVSVGGDPNPDNTISIQYGTGDATGYEAQETMSLGSPPITIRNQTFMTIVQLSESFYNSPCDGLMVRQNSTQGATCHALCKSNMCDVSKLFVLQPT